jgi:TRAP-type C4-dicarboxylate transport system permease small subunit
MLTRVNGWLLAGATSVTWMITGLLVVLVMVNVVARYVFGLGVLWAEEVSRLMFVWVVFLGAYIALCRKGHMAIVMVVDALPDMPRRLVRALGWVLVLVFLVVLAFSGYRLVASTLGFGRTTPILGISAAWAYLSVPVAAALMALRALEEIVDAWRGAGSAPDMPAQGSAP